MTVVRGGAMGGDGREEREREGSERREGGIRLKENSQGGMKGGSRKEKKTGEERFKASCPTPPFFPFFVSSSDIFSVPVTHIKLFSKVFKSLCFSISCKKLQRS